MRGGVKMTRWLRIRPVCLQFSSKLLKFFFDESCGISAFTKNFFEKLRTIEIGPRGRWKRSSIFQMSHPSKKSMHTKANEQRKKKTICKIFHQKKKSESFDENWRNGGRFSKFGQFCARCFDFSDTLLAMLWSKKH